MSGIYRVGRSTIAVLISIFLLGACETSPTQENVGTVVGAAIGGLVGSQLGSGSGRTAAIVGGVVLGGLLGRTIGRYMDDSDRARANEVLDTASTGETVAWRNPDSGYDFTMTPTRDYQSNEGHPCRDFVQEVFVDGERQHVDGSACKEPDDTRWMTS